eukprot:gene10209-10370_t
MTDSAPAVEAGQQPASCGTAFTSSNAATPSTVSPAAQDQLLKLVTQSVGLLSSVVDSDAIQCEDTQAQLQSALANLKQQLQGQEMQVSKPKCDGSSTGRRSEDGDDLVAGPTDQDAPGIESYEAIQGSGAAEVQEPVDTPSSSTSAAPAASLGLPPRPPNSGVAVAAAAQEQANALATALSAVAAAAASQQLDTDTASNLAAALVRSASRATLSTEDAAGSGQMNLQQQAFAEALQAIAAEKLASAQAAAMPGTAMSDKASSFAPSVTSSAAPTPTAAVATAPDSQPAVLDTTSSAAPAAVRAALSNLPAAAPSSSSVTARKTLFNRPSGKAEPKPTAAGSSLSQLLLTALQERLSVPAPTAPGVGSGGVMGKVVEGPPLIMMSGEDVAMATMMLETADSAIVKPALVVTELLGFGPDDEADISTALAESGGSPAQLVASYLHNIRVWYLRWLLVVQQLQQQRLHST